MASARSAVNASRVLNRLLLRPFGAHTSIGNRFCIDPGLAPWADSSGHFGPQVFPLQKFVQNCLTALGLKEPSSSEKRPLGIPTVRDRVVQTAVRMAIEPVFEREFAEHSYGF